jgi:hypothetical protein
MMMRLNARFRSFPAIFYLAAPKRPPAGLGRRKAYCSWWPPTPLWLAWRAAFMIHAAFQCRELEGHYHGLVRTWRV